MSRADLLNTADVDAVDDAYKNGDFDATGRANDDAVVSDGNVYDANAHDDVGVGCGPTCR